MMATEKVHSVIHTPNDATRFCHYLNACWDAPEKGHKKWVGQQGLNTNQRSRGSTDNDASFLTKRVQCHTMRVGTR